MSVSRKLRGNFSVPTDVHKLQQFWAWLLIASISFRTLQQSLHPHSEVCLISVDKAVLSQREDKGLLHPVTYALRSLHKHGKTITSQN